MQQKTGGLSGALHAAFVVGALVLAVPLVTPSSAIGSARRTVIIVDPQRPPAASVVQTRLCTRSPLCENGKDGIDVVERQSGRLPAGAMPATVLSDTNCAPDSYGISHCRNVLRLANGDRIVVRHSHNMSLYPCLAPGETVSVTALR